MKNDISVANQRMTSATALKQPGVEAPDVALGASKRMRDNERVTIQYDGVGDIVTEKNKKCPECNGVYSSFRGVCIHYRQKHDGKIHLQVECGWCGNSVVGLPSDFKPEVDNHFCSDNCRKNWFSEHQTDRESVECAYCGTVLELPKSRIRNVERNFCSVSCQGGWLSENNVGEKHPNWKDNLVEVECGWCEAKVRRTKKYVERYENVFCNGSGCYSKWSSENSVRENNPNYDSTVHEITTCDYCGVKYEYHTTSRQGKYCSYSCAASDRTGKDAPNWKGGWVDGDYGPNWRTQRKKALERDGHECLRCGINSSEHKKQFGQDLVVHHIRRKELFRREDGSLNFEEANDLSNLVTVCVNCHWKIEGLDIHLEWLVGG